MLSRLILVLSLLLSPAVGWAQTQRQSNITGMRVLGQAVANEFGKWQASVDTGFSSSGVHTVSLDWSSFVVPDGMGFMPITTAIPIKINDPGRIETVTPSAVNCAQNSGICTFTANFAQSHPSRFQVGTGTYGLQEAIEFMRQSGGTVLLTQDWPGSDATVGAITSGTTSVSLYDTRAGAIAMWTWNGSYTKTFSVSSSGVVGISSTAVLNNIRYCNLFSGSTLDAKIHAAAVDLPSTGGTIVCLSEGAQSVTGDAFSGITKPGVLILGNMTVTATATQNIPSNWLISGAGWGSTIWNFNQASGVAFDVNAQNYTQIQNMKIAATSAGNSAVGVRIRNDASHHTIEKTLIDSFATNLKITGTNAPARPFDIRVVNSQITNATACGICLDHAVDIYFTNVLNWAVLGNPTTAWGFIMDTGTSGVQINAMSMIAGGFKIQNSAPSAATYDLPPEFLYAHQLIVDTITGTDGILLDSSLSVADGASRLGKSYHFTESWASFTQTDDKDGVNIAGGEDISFTDFRARLNRRHGIHISSNGSVGPNNVRITQAALFGNNQQGLATGSGLYVDGDSHISQISVTNSRMGNVAGDGSDQRYGIYLAAGPSDQITLTDNNVSSNISGGLSDNNTGGNRTIRNTNDYLAGTVKVDYTYSDKYRFVAGEGNFYLEYNVTVPNTPLLCWDANDCQYYNRTNNSYEWNIASTRIAAISATNGLEINKVNAIRYASFFTGSDGGAKITAAIADLPSTGGTVDARGLEGNQTISSDLTIGTSTKPVMLLLNPGSVWTLAASKIILQNGSVINGGALCRETSQCATIRRTSGTTTLIEAVGTVGASTHVHGWGLVGLYLDGGGTAGYGLNVGYADTFKIEDVQVRNGGAKTALYLHDEVWDFTIQNSTFAQWGDASNYIIDMAGTDATHQITDGHWYGNDIGELTSSAPLLRANAYVLQQRYTDNKFHTTGGTMSHMIDWSGYYSAFINCSYQGDTASFSGGLIRVKNADNQFIGGQASDIGHGPVFQFLGPGGANIAGMTLRGSGSPTVASAIVADATSTGAISLAANTVYNFAVGYDFSTGSSIRSIGPSAFFGVTTNVDYTTPGGTWVTFDAGKSKISASAINAVRFADRFTGVDAGDKIAAAIADLPSTGGVVDARGLEGTQTWGTCPFAATSKSVELYVGAGVTTVASPCTLASKSIIIHGMGMGAFDGTNPTTTLKYSGVGNTGIFETESPLAALTLYDLQLDGNGRLGYGIWLKNNGAAINHVNATRVSFYQLVNAIKLGGDAGTTSNYNAVTCDHCNFYANTASIEVNNVNNEFMRFTNSLFAEDYTYYFEATAGAFVALKNSYLGQMNAAATGGLLGPWTLDWDDVTSEIQTGKYTIAATDSVSPQSSSTLHRVWIPRYGDGSNVSIYWDGGMPLHISGSSIGGKIFYDYRRADNQVYFDGVSFVPVVPDQITQTVGASASTPTLSGTYGGTAGLAYIKITTGGTAGTAQFDFKPVGGAYSGVPVVVSTTGKNIIGTTGLVAEFRPDITWTLNDEWSFNIAPTGCAEENGALSSCEQFYDISAKLATPESMADNAWTTVIFDTKIKDIFGQYSTSTGVFTPLYRGCYVINTIASVTTGVATAFQIGLRLNINGSTTSLPSTVTGWAFNGDVGAIPLNWFFCVNAGDSVKVELFQNIGGAINTSNTDEQTMISIHKVGAPGYAVQ